MAKHDMGPSDIEGFNQQCRKCGALDTEIRFALGENCPADDLYITPGSNQGFAAQEPGPAVEVVMIEPTYAQRVMMVQHAWFQGYFARQFLKSL